MIFTWSNMMTGIDDTEFGGDFGAAMTASAEMMQHRLSSRKKRAARSPR